jgi:hypothetical protein
MIPASPVRRVFLISRVRKAGLRVAPSACGTEGRIVGLRRFWIREDRQAETLTWLGDIDLFSWRPVFEDGKYLRSLSEEALIDVSLASVLPVMACGSR